LGGTKKRKLEREENHQPGRGFRRDEEKKTLEGVLGSTGRKKWVAKRKFHKECGCNHLLADSQGQAGVDGAAVSGAVIGRHKVGSIASIITSLADGRGAGGGRVGGQNSETVLGELGVDAHVDAGEIPEDSVGGLGVLELQDISLVGVGGQLDGDTAAVGVGLPGLAVGTTVGSQDLHGTDDVGDGPGVDVVGQVVGDQDGATSGHGVVAADHVVHAGRKGRGQGSEGSGNAESLSEHHFDKSDVVRKDCGKSRYRF